MTAQPVGNVPPKALLAGMPPKSNPILLDKDKGEPFPACQQAVAHSPVIPRQSMGTRADRKKRTLIFANLR